MPGSALQSAASVDCCSSAAGRSRFPLSAQFWLRPDRGGIDRSRRGAAAGGLIGALTESGIPEEDRMLR